MNCLVLYDTDWEDRNIARIQWKDHLLREKKLAYVNISGATPFNQRVPHAESSLPNTDITRRLTNVENKPADHEVLFVENTRTTVETSPNLQM